LSGAVPVVKQFALQLASESSELKVLKLPKQVTSLQVKVLSFIFNPLLPESKLNLLK